MDTNTINVYALMGKKRSGKDTVGGYIKNLTDNNVMLSFAKPVKDACSSIFSIPIENFYDDDLKEEYNEYYGYTNREIMQGIATDLLRNEFEKVFPKIGKNLWVMNCKKRILDNIHNNNVKNIIITDVRFENEIEMIKNLVDISDYNFNINFIRVNRPDLIKENDNTQKHESENSIDNIDINQIVINNDGTLQDLYRKVSTIIN